MLWLRALHDKALFREDSWWDDPIRCCSCSVGTGLECVWKHPIACTLKFNVDGVASGNVSGCSGVLRNHLGDIKAILWTVEYSTTFESIDSLPNIAPPSNQIQ
ncbi:hypothetical protein V6N13_126466 [Hibiscus sabdariffa]